MEQYQSTHPVEKSGIPTWVTVLLVVIAIVGIVAGVYFWQASKVSEVERQAQQLQEQLSAVSAQDAVLGTDSTLSSGSSNSESSARPARQLITGQIRQEQAGSDVVVACHVLTSSIDTLWVRYGNTLSPQKLTDKQQEDFTEGEPNIYNSYSVIIPAEAIEPGKLFSYQCLGSKGSETYRAGIASFTSLQ